MWVIVDRLTKSAHFLAMRITFILEDFGRLYIQETISIVADWDPMFTNHFLKSFQKAMGTRLMMSITFHP